MTRTPQYHWSWPFASRSSSGSSAVRNGDQFWALHFSAMSDGDVFHGTEIYTDRVQCAAQVTGCKIFGFSTVLAMALQQAAQACGESCHPFELQNPSSIIPNHLRHAPHVPETATAPLTHGLLLLYRRRPMVQEYGRFSSRAMCSRRFSASGLGASSAWVWRALLRRAEDTGSLCTRIVHVLRARCVCLCVGGGGCGFSDIGKLDSLVHLRCGHGVNMYVGTPEHQFLHSYVLSYYLNSVTSQ